LLLPGAAILILLAGAAYVLRHRQDGWTSYIFAVGQPPNALVSHAELHWDPGLRELSASIPHVPAPWTSGFVRFDPANKKLLEVALTDAGTEMVLCAVAPCPQPRLKSVEQMRKEGEAIERELVAKLGTPAGVMHYGMMHGAQFIWDYGDASMRCPEERRPIGKLSPEMEDRLKKVDLQVSDDTVSLIIAGYSAADLDSRAHSLALCHP
jgi:hypothetical protein